MSSLGHFFMSLDIMSLDMLTSPARCRCKYLSPLLPGNDAYFSLPVLTYTRSDIVFFSFYIGYREGRLQ